MTMRFFIFGAGYSGKAIAALTKRSGLSSAGTTRSQERFDALRDSAIDPHLFDGTTVSPAIVAELRETTHLVVSIAPGADDPVLAVAGDTIRTAMPKLRWIGYLSTVGVYGNHEGRWIDEDADCNPASERSRERLRAERAWLELGRDISAPVAVLRLSGIYGPGRNALLNIEKGTARRIVKPGQIFNRIHVEDIAGATLHLARSETGGVFNVTDNEPAPAEDVVTYAAALMKVQLPPAIAFEDANLTPMALSFYGENKRVSNARIKQAGYVFTYPDYRAALDALWSDGTYRGAAA